MEFTEQLLGAADEVRLAREIEAGVLARAVLAGEMSGGDASTDELNQLVLIGQRAWLAMWQGNFRMVALQASRAERRGGDYDECFQDGCIGLAEGIRRWDHRMGTRFSTVAWKWIHHHIQQSLAMQSREVTSRQQWRRAAMVKAVAARVEQQTGRELGIGELARATELTVEQVQSVSGPRLVGLGPDAELLVDERSSQAFEAVETSLPGWLWRLGDRQQRVLVMRYGLDGGPEHSYAACARRLGCSPTTVRREERRALAAARVILQAGEPMERLAA